MLIDEFMPVWDVSEPYSSKINVAASKISQAMRRLSLRRARLANFLFRLPRIPAAASQSIDGLLKIGFVLLGEKFNEDFLLGLTDKLWKPTGGSSRSG